MSAEFLILDNEKAAKLFSQSGYDIRQAAQMLEQEYVSLYSDFS